MKTKTSISVDADLLEKARLVAKRNHRSFSGQLEAWISEELPADPPSENTKHKPTGERSVNEK
ncbi:MAG: hypothetical protein CMO55_12240 [Verrucomicrobiales bacterium]|nr:hypothetical protein [Verrucomicrobiales bacterium]